MSYTHKIIDGVRVNLTDAEKTILKNQDTVWNNGKAARELKQLRAERDILIAQTDWMANSDVTMSDAWKTYRQALRDITSQTPSDTTLGNINWPTKPS